MTAGWTLYRTLKRLEEVCQVMSAQGMVWNFEEAKKLEEEYTAKRDAAAGPLIKFAEKLGLPGLNLNSPKQLQELYFNRFKCTPLAWSEKGTPQLNEDVLTAYVSGDNQAAAEFSKKLLDVRGFEKLLGTYIKNGPEPGKTTVHGKWRSNGTVTGRFSCSGFGMQTLPAAMRPLLKAREGCYLAETDYSQLEIRTIAVQADIKLFRKTYEKEDGDVYMDLARAMFGKPNLEKESEEGQKLRQLSKANALSKNYLASDETTHRMMYRNPAVRAIYPDLTLKQVAAMGRMYLAAVPELARWWKKIEEESVKAGYYEEKVSGRKVPFYGPPETSFHASFRNQALGASVVNRAFLEIYDNLGPNEQLNLQCHDAIVVSGPDPRRLEKLTRQHMETILEFEGRQIALPVTCKTAKTYDGVK